MLVDAGTLQFAVAPIIAVVVVCLLGLLLRWIFGTGRRARVYFDADPALWAATRRSREFVMPA